MTARLPIHRRWATALRWPFGIALASWRYMWSVTPVHLWEMAGSWPEDAPPELPAGADRPDLQRWQDGVGPLVHRIYRTRFTGSRLGPAELIALLREDMDLIAPTEFATFRKLEGEGPMTVGDDYVVRMPGPWDGPVTVLAVADRSFRLATLSGHLEAGQIEFRAASDHRGVSFEIESWARSGDRLSDLLYTRVHISKEVQLHMWASTLRNAVALAGGRMQGGITITTRRLDPHALPLGEGDPGEIDPRDRRDLAELAQRSVNFDPAELEAATRGAGWRVDEMVETLPHEASGPPREGGSWLVAKRMMDDYQLADPLAVSGVYVAQRSLAGREILLKIRYGPLRFRVGVRIGEPREETVELDGREVLRYGWSYRTLEGHFEAGEMRYELRKWLDTGDVEFRLRAVSRPAPRGPLLPRLGFRLVGRPRQLRFYRQVCRRVRRLTEAQIETERARASRRRLPLAS
jgi:uncharacterized protein (UPF0548 family)